MPCALGDGSLFLGHNDLDALSCVSSGHTITAIKADCFGGLSNRGLRWRGLQPQAEASGLGA